MTGIFRSACVALVVVSGVLAVGCSKKTKLDLVPMSGKVTVDGQPLTAGQVTLTPMAKDQVIGGVITCAIDNGTFTIKTDGKPGAPLGKYKVTVTPSMVPPAGGAKGPPPSLIDRKYQEIDKTPLTLEVVANPQAGQYDLKLAKSTGDPMRR